MELKEIERKVSYLNISNADVMAIMSEIESFGKEQYNQALEDAASNATAVIEHVAVDKQSILTLKKH